MPKNRKRTVFTKKFIHFLFLHIIFARVKI